jgi:hypothetical protein
MSTDGPYWRARSRMCVPASSSSVQEGRGGFFGPFSGNGFVPGLGIGRADVFVMPGPYERKENVEARLSELADRVPKY